MGASSILLGGVNVFLREKWGRCWLGPACWCPRCRESSCGGWRVAPRAVLGWHRSGWTCDVWGEHKESSSEGRGDGLRNVTLNQITAETFSPFADRDRNNVLLHQVHRGCVSPHTGVHRNFLLLFDAGGFFLLATTPSIGLTSLQGSSPRFNNARMRRRFSRMPTQSCLRAMTSRSSS